MDNTRDIKTGGSSRSHTQPEYCFDIYYQNVIGLRNKQLQIYENICSTDYNNICLTETWLNDLCCDHNICPDCYTVFRSDRVSLNKTYGGGVLIALFSRVRSYKGRYNLESCVECIWVEIATSDGLNLLFGNHYFPVTLNLKTLLTTFFFFRKQAGYPLFSCNYAWGS
jgi:hypothetical protein